MSIHPFIRFVGGPIPLNVNSSIHTVCRGCYSSKCQFIHSYESSIRLNGRFIIPIMVEWSFIEWMVDSLMANGCFINNMNLFNKYSIHINYFRSIWLYIHRTQGHGHASGLKERILFLFNYLIFLKIFLIKFTKKIFNFLIIFGHKKSKVGFLI